MNGRKVTIPSFQCRGGDKIEVREKAKKLDIIKAALDSRDTTSLVGWLNLDKDNLSATVVSVPSRQEIPVPMNEQLIVELYSK